MENPSIPNWSLLRLVGISLTNSNCITGIYQANRQFWHFPQAGQNTNLVRLLTWPVLGLTRSKIGRCLSSVPGGSTTVGCMAGTETPYILGSAPEDRFAADPVSAVARLKCAMG